MLSFIKQDFDLLCYLLSGGAFRLSDSYGWSIVLRTCTASMLMPSHRLQFGMRYMQLLHVLATCLLHPSQSMFTGPSFLSWKRSWSACVNCSRDRIFTGSITWMWWDASFHCVRITNWWRSSRHITDQMMSMVLFIGMSHFDWSLFLIVFTIVVFRVLHVFFCCFIVLLYLPIFTISYSKQHRNNLKLVRMSFTIW